MIHVDGYPYGVVTGLLPLWQVQKEVKNALSSQIPPFSLPGSASTRRLFLRLVLSRQKCRCTFAHVRAHIQRCLAGNIITWIFVPNRLARLGQLLGSVRKNIRPATVDQSIGPWSLVQYPHRRQWPGLGVAKGALRQMEEENELCVWFTPSFWCFEVRDSLKHRLAFLCNLG